jgi:hypothetical protein
MSYTINLFVLFLFFNSFNLFAQNNNLFAKRNRESEAYKIGEKVLIKFDTEGKIEKTRGIILEISEAKITFGNKRGTKHISIPIENISLLRRINPTNRIIYGILGTALISGGAALIDSGGDTPGSAMRGALLIPVVGVGVYILGAIPVSIIIERLSEKKRDSGWKFSVQN